MADRSPLSRLPDADDEQSRQALLVTLCALGLVVAAFAVPPVDAGGGFGFDLGGGDGGAGSGGGGAGGGGGEGIGLPNIGLPDLLRYFLPEGDGGGGAVCTVELDREPVPGRVVTARVSRVGEPVAGARVSFNDEVVGRTDERGLVRGEVPYDRQLVITVELPEGETCRARAGEPVEDESVGALRSGLAGAAVPRTVDGTRQSAPADNVTESYEIEGEVRIRVVGTPYPGETVTTVAVIRGEPVRNATVAVDGETVGRTDEAGRYALAVPADGTERLEVRVERGDFFGSRTVRVALLDATLSVPGLVAIPGRSATLTAAFPEGPVGDAVVERDGRRIGRTDEDGQLTVELPADPTATFTVDARDQTARVGVWKLYAGTGIVAVILVFVAGTLLLAAGRRAPGVARRAPRDVRGVLSRVLDRVVAGALALATRLTGLAAWLEPRLVALWTWLRTRVAALPGSLLAVGTLWARVRALPGAAWRRLRSLSAWIRSLPVRLRRWWRAVGDSEGTADGDEPDDGGTTATGTDGVAADPPTLRERWRTFARWVVPDRWRQRTPGEVARRAVDEGFPRESVAELTAVFREVEYGGRERSPDAAERARSAFDAIAAHRRQVTAGGHGTDGSAGGRPGDGQADGHVTGGRPDGDERPDGDGRRDADERRGVDDSSTDRGAER